MRLVIAAACLFVVAHAVIVREQTVTKTNSNPSSMTTPSIADGTDELYLAVVGMNKDWQTPAVASITGLGLVWTRVGNASQCSSSSSDNVIDVYSAQGVPTVGGGAVTVTFSPKPDRGLVAVTRFSGVHVTAPIGVAIRGNRNGLYGTCSGSDASSFSVTGFATLAATSIIFGAAVGGSRTLTPGSGYSLAYSLTMTSSRLYAQEHVPTSNETNVVFAGSYSDTTPFAYVAVELLAEAVNCTCTGQLHFHIEYLSTPIMCTAPGDMPHIHYRIVCTDTRPVACQTAPLTMIVPVDVHDDLTDTRLPYDATHVYNHTLASTTWLANFNASSACVTDGTGLLTCTLYSVTPPNATAVTLFEGKAFLGSALASTSIHIDAEFVDAEGGGCPDEYQPVPARQSEAVEVPLACTPAPTLEPTREPTSEPTLEPTLEPTPAPTSFCSTLSCAPTPPSYAPFSVQMCSYTSGTCVGASGACSMNGSTPHDQFGACSGTDTPMVHCCSNADCVCGCTSVTTVESLPFVVATACPRPCSVVEDCVDPQPENMCLQRDCWAGVMCMDVPAVNCDDFDACTADRCETENATAVCHYDPIVGCCTTGADCPAGNACQEPICVANACTFFNYTDGCCLTDAECVIEYNLCLESTCVANVCSEPTARNCSMVDDDDRCTLDRCNGTSGECYVQTLPSDLCPGACCLPNGTCADGDSMDEAWCLYVDGAFLGPNTRCLNDTCVTEEPTPAPTAEPSPQPSREPSPAPSAEPTGEPSSEPSREPSPLPTGEPSPIPTNQPTTAPTPAPTFVCVNASHCPAHAPSDKCARGACINNTCVFVAASCPARTPCSLPFCHQLTGLCHEVFNYSCCAVGLDAHCYDPAGACVEAYCRFADENATTGACDVRAVAGCCTSSANCSSTSLCERSYCDRARGRCTAPEPVVCPAPSDECDDAVCDSETGACTVQRRVNDPKCDAPLPATVPTTSSVALATPASMPVVGSDVAAYAHTLCRVLHACGDGDEATCLAVDEARPLACTTLRCCAVIGIP